MKKVIQHLRAGRALRPRRRPLLLAYVRCVLGLLCMVASAEAAAKGISIDLGTADNAPDLASKGMY